MAELGHEVEDDLAEACSRAPKFGLNAKALILQAALAQDDEPPAQRPGGWRGRRGVQRERWVCCGPCF